MIIWCIDYVFAESLNSGELCVDATNIYNQVLFNISLSFDATCQDPYEAHEVLSGHYARSLNPLTLCDFENISF